jgi:hypothetical protein
LLEKYDYKPTVSGGAATFYVDIVRDNEYFEQDGDKKLRQDVFDKIQSAVDQALQGSAGAGPTGLAQCTPSVKATPSKERGTWQKIQGFCKAILLRLWNASSGETGRLANIRHHLFDKEANVKLDIEDLQWFSNRTIAQLGAHKEAALTTEERSKSDVPQALDRAIREAPSETTRLALAVLKCKVKDQSSASPGKDSH